MDRDRRKKFERMFFPKSLAIVGISRTDPGLGGQFFLKNLRRAQYPGRIDLVHPTASEIEGLPAYPSLSVLPDPVDLALVCIPARFVPAVLEDCIRRGIPNAHILSSGFKELGTPEGFKLEQDVRRISAAGGLNVIGPNCMGPYVPASGLMLWGQIPANPGSFAFLSQSGTLAQRMSEHAHFTGMGISKAVSFGNAAVLDSADYLEYLAEDPATRIIGLYIESVQEGRRFLDGVRRLNRTKPILLWKGGESPSGAGAVASHTGTLAGKDSIWAGGLRQAGVTRLHSLDEAAGTAMAFLYLPPIQGRNLFILGGGGGNSVFYADICSRLGLRIPPLAGETRRRLTNLLPEVGSFARNPVDAWKSFYDPDYLAQILELAYADSGLDMILVDRLIPRMTYGSPETKDHLPRTIEYLQKNRSRKPLVVVIEGSGEDPFLAAEAARWRSRYCQAGIPAYASLPLAAQALAHWAAHEEKVRGRNFSLESEQKEIPSPESR